MPLRLLLARCFLAPILLYQGIRVRKLALRLPEAAGARSGVEVPTHGAASAVNAATPTAGKLGKPAISTTPLPPLRLLVLGDSSAAGVGVATQDLALAQICAQQLAQRNRRAVAWQLLAESGLDSRTALRRLQGQWAAALQPADVVLLVLGVNDVSAQRSPRTFVQHYAALLQTVQAATGAQLLLANALPPMQHMPALPWPLRPYLGGCARALDAALQLLCLQRPAWQHLPAPVVLTNGSLNSGSAADGFHPSAQTYRLWAEAAAAGIDQALHSQTTTPAALSSPSC